MQCVSHLDVSSVLLLSKCQAAEQVEESSDLLWGQVVHVVQNTLPEYPQFTPAYRLNIIMYLKRPKQFLQNCLNKNNIS